MVGGLRMDVLECEGGGSGRVGHRRAGTQNRVRSEV